YVGGVIAARVSGASSPGPFRYRHQGDLATIGRGGAGVNLKHLQLTGFPGWLFWSVVHIYFLIGLRSRFIVAFSWAWQYLTFQRVPALITGIGEPGECEEPDAALNRANPVSQKSLQVPVQAARK